MAAIVHTAAASLLLLLLGGCGQLRPRLGYPWVESALLSLEHETLDLRIERGELVVRAAMIFRAHDQREALEMLFPEDARDAPLRELAVRWAGARLATNVEPAHVFDGGPPLSHVRRWHRFVVGPLSRGETRRLIVGYRQRLPSRARRVRYLLRTGAYWRGPIRSLAIRLDDPASHTIAARFGDTPPRRSGHRLWWSLRDVEPRSDVVLELTKETPR
ncbi:MAG: hypothetical protein KC503_41125 [Myxococcales bacterium]|nr:hypothetical protein [Myxococcales bacterium]